MGDILVREAREDELAEILRVQYDAFGRVSEHSGIPPQSFAPLRETLDELIALRQEGVRFFVALDDDRVVGSVRGLQTGSTVEIGRLVVDGRFLRRGVATALMDALETSFEDANRFVLFTGAQASVPLALYTKRGYEVFKSESLPHVELVWLEKDIANSSHV